MKKPSNNTKKHRYYYLVIFLGLSSILFLTSLTQTLPTHLNSQVSATSNNDGTVSSSSSVNASVTVGVGACTFERDIVNGGNGNYTGTLANGATPIEVDGSIFEIKCNDGGGSAIYAIGYSNDQLTNTDLISSLGSDTNIHTGVYNPEDTTHNSSWAMKMKVAEGGYSGAVANFGDFSTFQPIPNNYTMVASYPSSTLDPTGTVTSGGKIQAVYQAYASYTQPAGTYTGQVKYTMVHPNTNIPNQPYSCPANNICYYPNAEGAETGTMGNQTITSTATSATLIASNFSRAGYGFAGWNTEYDGSGTFYGPNEDIEFTAGDYSGVNGGLSLYAVWVKSTGYLQDWNGCSSLTAASYNNGTINANLSSITALTDKRDNQTYAVARLADGNCWMIENLRLDNNSTTPNWGNDNLSQGFGGVFHGLADAETASFSNSTVANSLYSTDGSNGTYNITYTSNDPGSLGYRMPRYRKDNTSARASSPTSGTNTNIYSYGNYYTWAAAIASTLHYSNPTATDPNGKTSETAGTSICPSGWKLPYGRNTGNGSISGGFSYLDAQMGGSGADANANTNPTGADRSKVWRSFPNNFLYSGYAGSGDISSRGSRGSYWSSSASNNNGVYGLFLNSSRLSPGTYYYYKHRGFTVRCVVDS